MRRVLQVLAAPVALKEVVLTIAVVLALAGAAFACTPVVDQIVTNTGKTCVYANGNIAGFARSVTAPSADRPTKWLAAVEFKDHHGIRDEQPKGRHSQTALAVHCSHLALLPTRLHHVGPC